MHSTQKKGKKALKSALIEVYGNIFRQYFFELHFSYFRSSVCCAVITCESREYNWESTYKINALTPFCTYKILVSEEFETERMELE